MPSRTELARQLDNVVMTGINQNQSKIILDIVKKILPANSPFQKNKLVPKNVDFSPHFRTNLQTAIQAIQSNTFENPQMAILLNQMKQSDAIATYRTKKSALYQQEAKANENLQSKKTNVLRLERIVAKIPSKPGQRLFALQKRSAEFPSSRIQTGRVGAKRRNQDISTDRKRQKPVNKPAMNIPFMPSNI